MVIIGASGDSHYACVGVEIGELRSPMTFPPSEDLSTLPTAETSSLLADLCREDGAVTLDLRFQRDPARSELRAAVLARVYGRSRAHVESEASSVLDRLQHWALADVQPLGRDHLLEWLKCLADDAGWSWLVHRRVSRSDGSMPDTAAFRPITATSDGWFGLLDELIGLPARSVVGVRLRGCVPPSGDTITHACGLFQRYASAHYESAAQTLGAVNPMVHPASAFAIDAAIAMGDVLRHWTHGRYGFEIYARGHGEWNELKKRFESLVPWSMTEPNAAAFRSSPLRVYGVADPTLWKQFQTRKTNLDIAGRDIYDLGGLRPDLQDVAATVDELEAASLFHMPRSGPPPTPGFSGEFEASSGIPTSPFVFISYSHRDRDLVWKLSRIIKSWGLTAWWDARIVADTDWSRELEAALANGHCRVVLVALTERSARSPAVGEEIDLARKHGRPVVQVMLRPAEPVDDRRQYVDLRDWRGNASDQRLQVLNRDLAVRMQEG